MSIGCTNTVATCPVRWPFYRLSSVAAGTKIRRAAKRPANSHGASQCRSEDRRSQPFPRFRSAKHCAFRGEGFEFLPEFLLFRPQAVRVQGTPESIGVPLRVGKAARSDGGQRSLDVEQALPDLRFPLRDHAQSGFDGCLNVIRAGLGRVLAGIPGRKVLGGDRGVAECARLDGGVWLVRCRSAGAGEVGVGEARRRTVPLPARRDAGPVLARGLRQRRLILLSGR